MQHVTLCLWLWTLAMSAPVQQTLLPCGDPENDSWVREMRDRVLSFDDLALYALGRYGPPSECRGAVTARFDGRDFGALRLAFPAGIVFDVETFPPEMSTVTLRAEHGFDDPEAVRGALRAYASAIGLDVDWSAPEVTEEDDATVHTYWDPEAGLNGSASLVFSGTTLVAVRFSIAP